MRHQRLVAPRVDGGSVLVGHIDLHPGGAVLFHRGVLHVADDVVGHVDVVGDVAQGGIAPVVIVAHFEAGAEVVVSVYLGGGHGQAVAGDGVSVCRLALHLGSRAVDVEPLLRRGVLHHGHRGHVVEEGVHVACATLRGDVVHVVDEHDVGCASGGVAHQRDGLVRGGELLVVAAHQLDFPLDAELVAVGVGALAEEVLHDLVGVGAVAAGGSLERPGGEGGADGVAQAGVGECHLHAVPIELLVCRQ